jgi:hypothetical protein
MKSLGKKDKIILKQRDRMIEQITRNERIDEVKKQLLKITPTRYNNIIWKMQWDNRFKLPSDLTVYYFNEDLTSMRTSPKMTAFIEPEISTDGKIASYLIDEEPSNELYDFKTLYSYMGFDSNFIHEEFEFSVEVFLKYTYIIKAGKIQTEVSFKDGLLYHAEGDRFNIGEENLAVVMEINHEKGLVFCGAIGYNL